MKFDNYSQRRPIAPLQRPIKAVLSHVSRALVPGLAAALLLSALPGRAEDMLVSAAASLTNAFKDIGAVFEKSHPGTKVNFNFAASDEVTQAFKKDTGQSVKRTFDSSGTFAMAHRSRCICQPMRTTYSSFRPKGGPAIRACCTPSAASLTQLRPAS